MKPVPAKPATAPGFRHAVAVQARPALPTLGRYFIEKPQLRKVKCGKRRWVMV